MFAKSFKTAEAYTNWLEMQHRHIQVHSVVVFNGELVVTYIEE